MGNKRTPLWGQALKKSSYCQRGAVCEPMAIGDSLLLSAGRIKKLNYIRLEKLIYLK